MNRTLNEPARGIRIHCGLPKTFWVYAVSTVSYLFNRGPSVPMGFKIPEEVWTGKELKYSHLRTFGCNAYAHVDPEKRDKLDTKAIKFYFIGYGSDMFGYRFWDDRNKKILRHCDVTFDENVLYKDREQKIQETTKQVGVELELLKSTPKDGTVETQQTPETVVEEPEVEQVTPEQEKSMDDEMRSLDKNNTWILTELPIGKRALVNKWVFRIKAEPDGKKWFKARLVVKRYSQRKGSSMKEINSLKASLSSEFEMKDLGAVKQIFGMRISRDRSAGTLNLSQEQYVEKVLDRFRVNDAKPRTCSKRPRVVALALPNLQLQGTISPSLANLSFLRELNLENIFFHGDIPYGLGHLPHLRVIDVQNNQLKGNIPTSLFQHWRVQVISLAFNKLSGEMWQGPWYVPELRILNLRNNSLKGIIPPSIGNATKLLNFSLFGNRGNIPKEIGNLSQLAFLNLAVNQLTGFIPSSLFNVSSLLAIALGLNNLSGPLVLDEGNIVSNLESLSISRNQISGHIPSNICQLTELKILSISFNDITGEIPKNIDCLSKLKEFSIGYNPTDGTIPSSLGNISTLQYVYCVSNRLEGPIPPELGKLSNLIQLDFEENYIKGQIPKAIFNISSLKLIALTLNKLSGRIPTSTGLHLPNLEELHLTGNALEGEIPAHITNVTKLKYLGLADNFFSGSIPTNWGNLRDLRLLFLHINQLTSEHELPFFHSLADCRMLEYLDVGNNPLNSILPNSVGNLSSTIKFFEISDAHINGLIPPGIGNVSGLTTLVFQRNNLMGNIPPAIEGEVPTDIGGLKAIVELDLSSNHFSGMLPITLGDLQNLKILNLSNNSFSGPIPLSFASLISLEILDLSVNALSGTIPRSLEELLYLKAINVSFNDLEGEIPNGGVFANSTLQSFLGNKDLCGMHKLEVPSCPITNSGEQSKSKELVLKIVIPVLTSSSLIFFLVSIWIMKQKKKGKSKNVEKFWEIKTHQLISYHEIQRATNYFDGSNLLGVGSSGSVYKGTLSDGTIVAVKVLDLENEEVCKRFDAESKVMRNVRHRNLVPVISTCFSDCIRAFVLQFMPNGSLENWLYKEESHLNLIQRISIMLDVAMAIEYLHHGHNSPIVHCDLKPANILLDEDMVAHVGDFGISKILAVSKSMAHTETLGTLGYMAPEYGSEAIVSTSGDVYSCGIMLMEVLTKRRPTDEEICNENLDLRKWITQSFPGSMMDVVDDNFFPEEEQITSKSEICIDSVIQLALECTKETPESRINMKDVVTSLNKIKITYLGTRI
ncbi:hypothetical protein T459_13815 [Capsicum annuum]|uniref:non-specific serine/threonine protein kinase n=1 Tax=Capsicum annuum TaxID=4072 RepID=A0A2G2ZFN2_CAPAN|nr:hypothetical protein T459_13815 [Capsicum annuum]